MYGRSRLLQLRSDPRACTSETSCSWSPCGACSSAGHDPIAVVGGATGLIGDPSGRCRTADPGRCRRRLGREDRSPGGALPRFPAVLTRRGSSTTWTGPRRSPRSTCCATSGSTSVSIACSTRNRSRPGSTGRGSASPSSATRSCGLRLPGVAPALPQTGKVRQRPVGEPDPGVDLIRRVPRSPSTHWPRRSSPRLTGRSTGKREGDSLPRSGPDQPVRLLPVLPEPGRCRHRRAAADLQLPVAAGDQSLGGTA